MSIARDVFNDRCDEINVYFEFVVNIIDRKAALVFPLPFGSSPDTGRSELLISTDLSHTLKANGFMLLYNLTEATMSNAIAEIHEAISTITDLGSDDLNHSLSIKALRKFRSGTLGITKHCFNPVSHAVLQYWLDDHQKGVNGDHNPLFSGNVDAKKIREVAGTYGFSHSTTQELTKNGKSLVNVKTKRNQLAHGHVAFKECGQDMTLSDIMNIKEEVIHYLDEILTNIETYMTNKEFLRNPPINPTASVAHALL